MNASDLARAMLLSQFYSKLSDEEKLAYLQRMNEKRHEEIVGLLGRQERQMDDIGRRIGKHPFVSDLLANVTGNYLTELITLAAKTLLRKL